MSTFRIGFEGPSVAGGEIEVADLAPSLLALGELIETANRVVNKDRAEAKLKIRASEMGSFVAILSLDVSWITDMLDVIAANPDRVTAAKDLLDLLWDAGAIIGTVGGGAYGFFKVLKVLDGRRPDAVVENEDGTVSLTVGGTTLVVDKRVVNLLEDLPTREATEKFVRTSFKPKGIKEVTLDADGAGDSSRLVLTPEDIRAATVPEPTEEETSVETVSREALLKIVTGQFEEGYKWRFTDGTNTFTATMSDPAFLNRLDSSEIVLSKNDTLRCVIEETQTLAGTRLKTDTEIVEVKQHISGARQLRLL